MSNASSSEASRSGEILSGKYRLERRLGRGGMGAVFEAWDLELDRRVAVKFLLREFLDRPEVRARFAREAKATAGIESDHVVKVTERGVSEDGTPFLVMEYLEGEDLRSLLEREERLPLQRVAELALQVCRGLERAHRRGVVHRDLKPENLFVVRAEDGTDRCKILDFGVAKLETGTSGITRSGAQIGTLTYMPPEQLRGQAVDLRVDVYALGCVVYECLAGRPPHVGDEPHVVMTRILTEEPARLDVLRPGLPQELVQAVHRALDKDANGRQQSAAELGAALRPFAVGTREEHQGRAVEGTALSPLSSVRPSAGGSMASRPWSSLPRRAGALGAVLLAALLLVVLLTPDRPGRSATPQPSAVTKPLAASPIRAVPSAEIRVEPPKTAPVVPVPPPVAERSSRTAERSPAAPAPSPRAARVAAAPDATAAPDPTNAAVSRDLPAAPRGAKFDPTPAY
jgi:serine/threonine protein kinase